MPLLQAPWRPSKTTLDFPDNPIPLAWPQTRAPAPSSASPTAVPSPGDRYRELYQEETSESAGTGAAPTDAVPPVDDRPAADSESRFDEPLRPAPLGNEPQFPAAADDSADRQGGDGTFEDRQPVPFKDEQPEPALVPDDSRFAPVQPRSNPQFDQRPLQPVGTGAEPAAFDQPSATNNRLPAAEGQGRPGGRHLEGPQAPNLVLKKIAPPEIQVGARATFQISVQNTGQVVAQDVRIHDAVPSGSTLVTTKPEARVGEDGSIVWMLGTLEPDETRDLELEIIPQREGEIGSIASVTFRTDASVRTTVTKPELQLEVSGPRRVMINETLDLNVRVTNVGSGVAANVLLFDALPPELKHPAGPEVEYDVGDLQPGESREIQLNLTAAQEGQIVNVISAKGNGQVQAESSADIEIIAPGLQVSMNGPRRRYLERKATYTLTVANPGTAPAREVELVSHLPKGIQFVSANNRGRYDDSEHAVYWSLAELPEGESGSVKLVTLPVEAGQHRIQLTGRADQNLSDRREELIVVEGLPAIFFEVADVEDPVELGGETEYEIRVLNQGTKTSENIRVAALLPPDMEAISADGPTRHQVDGNRIFFEGLERLAPKADTTYRVRVRGVQPGDQRFRVQVQSDEMESPVTKEESTRVYADE